MFKNLTDKLLAGIKKHWLILLLLLLGLVVGLLLGNDYGMTFDEKRNAIVGETALAAYSGSQEYFTRPALDEHGPIYFMFFTITSRFFDDFLPNYTQADGRHLTHFLTFIATVLFVYILALRFMQPKGAFIASAFFATQPMLFGRGFINQKDTPFMAFFIATVALGFIAADHWRRRASAASSEPIPSPADRLWAFWRGFILDFKSMPAWRKWSLAAIFALSALLCLDLAVFGVSKRLAVTTIRAAYEGNALSPIQWLYQQVATDAYKTPLQLYLDKFNAAYRIGRWLAIPTIILIALTVGSLLSSRLAKNLGFQWGSLTQPMLYGSAIFLGATICTRQLGVFAGALVSLYFSYRNQLRALYPLIVYWLTAGLVTVATWPYLWEAPIRNFVDSLFLAATFPPHRQVFQGRSMNSANLPWDFFPTLATIEHTEPTVVLFLLGAGFSIYWLIKRRKSWFELLLIWLWFGLPLIGLIGFKMTVYGNLRHLLFILPPMLLLAGWGLAKIVDHIRPAWLANIVLAAAFLPGIYNIVRLHPYEYIYKNSFAGGVSGSYRYYELDRECISLRGGMEYVNQVADPGDIVMVFRQTSQVLPNARSDLYLIDDKVLYEDADYVIACHFPWDRDISDQGFKIEHSIKIGSARLTDIWVPASDP